MIPLLLAVLLLPQGPPDPWAVSPPDSVARLIDRSALCRLQPLVKCRQFASTDPSGRGEDHGHYLRTTDGERRVLAELEGPGVITRIWSANAAGRLLVTLDGEATPRIDCPFQDLFTGKFPPFAEPIATHKAGGWISYFPIPFAKSCRVEVAGLPDPRDLYYQVQCVCYPPGTKVRTFTRELPEDETNALREVLRVWKEPAFREGAATVIAPVPVPAGGSIRILDLDDSVSGFVSSIDFRWKSLSPEQLRGLVLKCHWDRAAEASIAVPLADLLGAGFGVVSWTGLLGGCDSEHGWTSLRMPFRRGARLEICNATDREIPSVGAEVLVARAPVPDDAGYLHAEFRAADGVGRDLYEFARVAGPGRLVGIFQALQGVGDLWYLEGNEEISVDGERKPSIVGTGTEDFYNGGWYWDGGTFALPLHGLGVKQEWTTNRTTPWRMFVPDAVSFADGLVGRIEHGSRNEVRDAYYSSVALWYGPRRAVREPVPDECRVPRLWVTRKPGFIGAAALAFGGDAEVERKEWEEISPDHRGLKRPLFQAFPVSYVEHDRPPLDARVVLFPSAQQERRYRAKIAAPWSDRFRLELRMVGGPGAGVVRVAVDGQPAGDVDTRAASVLPLAAKALGPLGLAAGEHELEFAVPARARGAGLDSWRLLSGAPFVRSWRVAPPVKAAAKGTVEDETEVEKAALAADFDPAGAGWKKVDARGDSVDLNAAVSRASPVFGYVHVFVQSPNARAAMVLLGSDDGARVWVNGALAFSKAVHRHLTVDEDRFEVQLREGWNRVLVKVRNDDGGYALALRVADVDGRLVFAADRTN